MSVITLLTDFGTRDEYVGLMKGVILSIHPSATIVDITHQIGSQDIVQAAYAIHSSYRYFPAHSIHLIVVDPGVGTSRSLLALEIQHHYFVAPDNGILSMLLDEAPVTELVKITNPEYFLNTVSTTFHGRDIIAPVGAYIAQGVELRQFGDRLAPGDAVRISDLLARKTADGRITGKIITVDHFGNLISNINSSMLLQNDSIEQIKNPLIQIGSHTIQGLGRTYADGQSQKPMALIGSRGFLEIAVPGDNAARLLKAGKGERVLVEI